MKWFKSLSSGWKAFCFLTTLFVLFCFPGLIFPDPKSTRTDILLVMLGTWAVSSVIGALLWAIGTRMFSNSNSSKTRILLAVKVLGGFLVFLFVIGFIAPKPLKPTYKKPLVLVKSKPPKIQKVEIPIPTNPPLVVVTVPDTGHTKRLRAYLADFEGVDWYGSYKSASTEGDTAKMTLDLPRNAVFRPTVENACGVMTGYINGKSHADEGLSRIEIRNTENEPLAWTGIDGSCSTFSGG